MQYKLGNIDQQQRLETISEQDRLMRERSAIDAVEAQRNATEKHRLTIDEIFTRANAELSKEPGYTYLQGKARLARQQGNKADEELYATQMAETMTPYVQALYKQTTGRDLTEKDIAATLAGGGVTGAEKGISEYGTSKRFTEELPIKKITAETSAGHLRLAREQFNAEQGAGGKAGKEYIDRWTKPLTDVINFLEPVARGDNVMTQMYQEPAGYMAGKLAEIQTRLNNGEKLTASDEKLISEGRDLKKLLKQYSVGRLIGQEKGPGSPTDIAETNQVEADINRAQMERMKPPIIQPSPPAITPSITIPENAPRAYNPTTGEMAYWDGTKWIIIK